ncbi:AAA family ATPase [Chryseobacterium sp. MMS23-Vi53]|uniref:AAA family ATPase n=1 Tax=Chryseobacterium sp. MMS23-Vi53 TaxID=3386644 RepID=UPI0039EC2C63
MCKELNLEYLSASQLLKWDELNKDSQNKKVNNILVTQNQLIIGLKNVIKNDQNYLLDGHYCLLNKANMIETIPFETFAQINPINLNIILGNIDEISKRLQDRDKKIYSVELLQKFQDHELLHAKQISKKLNINLNIGLFNDYSKIINSIHTKLAKP